MNWQQARWSRWMVSLVVLTSGACAGKKPAVAPSIPVSDSAPPTPQAPPALEKAAPTVSPSTSEEEWFRNATIDELQAKLSDVYFDYDRDELRSDTRAAVQRNFDWLNKPYNTLVIEVEGHCDERGTPNYNLALGDRRSTAVADYLTSLGLPSSRVKTITYGKERPQCVDPNEGCWWKNRRAHFRITKKAEQRSEP